MGAGMAVVIATAVEDGVHCQYQSFCRMQAAPGAQATPAQGWSLQLPAGHELLPPHCAHAGTTVVPVAIRQALCH